MTSSQKKILVIEDEKPLARALELKLNHAGFDAKSVSNGEEGLSLLQNENYSLAICDLMMPQMDGFTLLKKLKDMNIKTPIIILTNLSQAEDEKRAHDLGAAGFFIKSNTPVTEIVERVKQKVG